MNAAAVTQKLNSLSTVKRSTILKEDATGITARAYPKANADAVLAYNIAEAAPGWRIEELHTEEGRLDDVFRGITMPDTAKEGK